MIKLKDYLNEFVGTGTATSTFVGAKGQGIDVRLSGPFHPDFGAIKKLLDKQLDDTEEKVDNNTKITPIIDKFFDTVDLEELGLRKYEFDEIGRNYDESDFINSSTENWERVGIDINYDKNEPHINKEDYINKSTTNWKYVKLNQRR